MTRQEAVNKIAESKDIKSFCKKYCGANADDFYHDLILTIADYKGIEEVKNVEGLAYRILQNQINGKYTDYHKLYDQPLRLKKDIKQEEEKEPVDIGQINRVMQAKNSTEYYENELLRLVASGKSCRQIGREVGIPYKTISQAVNRAKKRLRKCLKLLV